MNADEATTPPQMDVIAIAVNSEMPPDEIQVIENLRRVTYRYERPRLRIAREGSYPGV
jgi:hypothetical protein